MLLNRYRLMSKNILKLITSYCVLNIIFWLVTNMLSSCSLYEKKIEPDAKHVRVISTNKVVFRGFDIPKGIFKGVLWPSENNDDFQIWTIEGDEEKFYNVHVLENFTSNKEVTRQWNVKEINGSNNTRRYTIQRKDKAKSVELELPVKKRDYSFAVLQNDLSDELILFMDISENIEDKGLFGYILIN